MRLLSRLFGQPERPEDTQPAHARRVRRVLDAPSAPRRDYGEHEDYDTAPVLRLVAWDYGWGDEPDTDGYGFAVESDGRIWPANRCLWSTWPELGVLVINTVGTQHHFTDLQDLRFAAGQPLRLLAEPENPYDPRAISIRSEDQELTAGYVKKGSTGRLRNLLRGQDFRVMALSSRYGAGGRRDTLKIVLYRPDRLLGVPPFTPHPPIPDPPKSKP